jgi:hypothetical protein
MTWADNRRRHPIFALSHSPTILRMSSSFFLRRLMSYSQLLSSFFWYLSVMYNISLNPRMLPPVCEVWYKGSVK